MVGQAMNDLRNRIIEQMGASCSCMTKTPIPEYHEADCLYKVLGDCLKLVENPRSMVFHILGDELTERLIKDNYDTINDLGDPWQESEYSGRVGLQSLILAAEVLLKICDPLKQDFVDLGNAIKEEVDKLPDDAINDIDKLMEVHHSVTQNWKPSQF